jgi:hypothetical protein
MLHMMVKRDQNVRVNVTHGSSRSSHYQDLKNVYVNVTHDGVRRLLLILKFSFTQTMRLLDSYAN